MIREYHLNMMRPKFIYWKEDNSPISSSYYYQYIEIAPLLCKYRNFVFNSHSLGITYL